MPLGVSIGVTVLGAEDEAAKVLERADEAMYARKHSRRGKKQPRSGDDVRRDLIFDEGDAVAQLKLALLQALQLQEIRRRGQLQGCDRCVEVTMLLLQAHELCLELTVVFIGHRLASIRIVSTSQSETSDGTRDAAAESRTRAAVAVHEGFQSRQFPQGIICGSGDCGKRAALWNTVGNRIS